MVCISCLLMSYVKNDVYGVWYVYLVYSCSTWCTMFCGVYVLFIDVLHEARCNMMFMSCLLMSYTNDDVYCCACHFYWCPTLNMICYGVSVFYVNVLHEVRCLWCVCRVYWGSTWNTMFYGAFLFFIDVLHEARCFMVCMFSLLMSYIKHDVLWCVSLLYWCPI
jgi:hypothetical protein